MQISALLVNYRSAADIAAALERVWADQASVAAVIVDNSEHPAEWQQLQSAVETVRARYPLGRVQLARAPCNVGFGAGCNLAARHAPDADAWLLVNPDVRLHPGCVAALAQALLAQPQLGAVAPLQALDEGFDWLLPPAWAPSAMREWAFLKAEGEPRHAQRLQRAIAAQSLGLWERARPGAAPSTDAQVVPQRGLSGGVVAVRATAARAVATGPQAALFDERFFMYFEDADLCRRLRRAGWALGAAPAARATHAWHQSPTKAALMADGAARFFARHDADPNPWRERTRRLLLQARVSPAGAMAAPHGGLVDGCLPTPGATPASPWLVEVGLHPLMFNAVAHWSVLPAVAWPPSPIARAVSSAPDTPLWLRVSHPEPDGTWHCGPVQVAPKAATLPLVAAPVGN